MLTTFRLKRRDAKQKLKAAKAAVKAETDPDKKKALKDAVGFWDSKQYSYKLLCNSEYGVNDSEFVPIYNIFESSLVTQSSRLIINNCRDHL